MRLTLLLEAAFICATARFHVTILRVASNPFFEKLEAPRHRSVLGLGVYQLRLLLALSVAVTATGMTACLHPPITK